MASEGGTVVPKQQQLTKDEVPDADEDHVYPPAHSALDSAPDIDVCTSEQLITSYEAN
jgi:hypothetical protein